MEFKAETRSKHIIKSSADKFWFKAETKSGHIIKSLAENLQHSKSKKASFVITKDKITSRMINPRKTTMHDLVLDRDKFDTYHLTQHKIEISINLKLFYKMLRTVKKNDIVTLFIEKSRPDKLGIKVVPKDGSRITTSYITTQSIQCMAIELPTGYDNPVNVSSSEFQKMCKEMNNIGKVVDVYSTNFYIKFSCTAGDIYSKEIILGKIDHDIENNKEDYRETFNMDRLVRIHKIAGLGTNIQIYTKTDLPLLVKSPIGDLGRISIYIKSNREIEEEEKENL